MQQPRPTEVLLIEVDSSRNSDYNTTRVHMRPRANTVLAQIRSLAAQATYGRCETEIPKTDCWMITYASGDYEIVTLGDAIAGTCRYPRKPVTYVAPMKLVWR